MNDIVIKHFEGRPVKFRSENGKLTMTMKEVGEILEYKNPAEYVGRLYVSHKDEFDNDCTEMLYIVGSGNTPPVRERVFTLEGLILLCMFSEQPKAKTFRHWLRKIGKQVMVEGYVAGPGLEKVLGEFGQALEAMTLAVKGLIFRMDVDVAQEQLPVAAPDHTYWPTPFELLKQSKRKIPPRFNQGGGFNRFVAKKSAEKGTPLVRRDRSSAGLPSDYVIKPTPEGRVIVKECFRAYAKQNGIKLRNAKPKA